MGVRRYVAMAMQREEYEVVIILGTLFSNNLPEFRAMSADSIVKKR
jgi:hypothetical protein